MARVRALMQPKRPPYGGYPEPGGNVERAREVRGLEREDLARKLGVEVHRVLGWERNDPAPTDGEIIQLALVLHFPRAFFRRTYEAGRGMWMHCDESEVCVAPGCVAIGDLLCDYPDAPGTCDAPLCYEHASEIGDDLHLCPVHMRMGIYQPRVEGWA